MDDAMNVETMPDSGQFGQHAAAAMSVINSSTSLDGTVKSSSDLRIEGQVNGVVECGGVLYVAQGATVDATVEAGGIIVEGSLNGTILCHGRLEIRSTGVVSAEVDTHRLVIHEGAVYEGRLRMDSGDRDASAQEPEEDAATALDDSTTSTSSSYPYLRSFGQSSRGDDDEPLDDSDDADRS